VLNCQVGTFQTISIKNSAWYSLLTKVVHLHIQAASQDEIRIYPRKEKLDNGYARIMKVDAQVLLVNLLADQLIVFCADSVVSIYTLSMANNNAPGKPITTIIVQSAKKNICL
jgi:hypothetical protein